MFLSATPSADLGILDAGVIAILGYAVVFFGLILLMVVVILLGRFFTAKSKKPVEDSVPAPAAPVAASVSVDKQTIPAPGSAGQLKLHNVEPKTAAMLMAIVANKMGKPLNELHFISIKEVD